jgi:FkbM family methyltransferase
VDIGANVGVYTVLAAGCCGATVLAIEPIAAAVAALHANLALNDLAAKVDVAVCGVSDTPGTLRFSADHGPMNRVLNDGETASAAVEVPVRTLDSLVEERVPTLIKMDVEGFERRVIAGGQSVLGDPRCSALIVELNGSGRRYGSSDDEVDAAIRGFGYTPVVYDPARRRLAPRRELTTGNGIYVREPERARQTLETATMVPVGRFFI